MQALDPSRAPPMPRWRAVVDALYARTIATDPALRARARDAGLADESAPGFYRAMAGAFMPVTPDLGALLYALVRLGRMRHVVEYGTSYGLSALHLAAALRDNDRHGGSDRGSGARLVTCEIEPAKAAQARVHLDDAGLAAFVDCRVGDARIELARDLPERIDLLFLDGAKADYLPLLRQLQPRLPAGALVVADNIAMPAARPFAAHLADPRHGWLPIALSAQALGASHPFGVALKLA